MTLGDKISKLRKENNYTQEQLADILGVSRQAVSKWESNITYPETDKLVRMSKLFQCTTDYLLLDENETVADTDPNGSEQHLDAVIKKIQENDKHTKYWIGVLALIAVIIVFYFGGDIIETIFSIGRTLGNAIGDLFWK